jgi:signal transduction histidine kinase
MFVSKRFTRFAGFWAFLVVVVVSYAGVFAVMGQPLLTWSNAAFVGLGVVYLGVAVAFGMPGAKSAESLAGRLIYFAIQMPLVTLIVFASPVQGGIALLVLPLVSQAVFMFPTVLVGLFSALLYAVTLAQIAAAYGWRSAFLDSLGLLAAFVFTIAFSYVAQREAVERAKAQALSAQLEEANQKLRDAAAQAEELAVARERNRLAREIHDGLGHYLTTIAVQLEAAQALLGGSPSPAADAVDKASKLSQEALADVRRSVGALRVDAPRATLVHQLEQLALADPQLMVAVAVRGMARELAPAVEHAFYRVAQEGLTNVRKHAGTGRAQLALDFGDPVLVKLAVEDDGRGERGGAAVAGFGLNGVRERVEQFGGRMQAAPRSQGGFALVVEMPG